MPNAFPPPAIWVDPGACDGLRMVTDIVGLTGGRHYRKRVRHTGIGNDKPELDPVLLFLTVNTDRPSSPAASKNDERFCSHNTLRHLPSLPSLACEYIRSTHPHIPPTMATGLLQWLPWAVAAVAAAQSPAGACACNVHHRDMASSSPAPSIPRQSQLPAR